VEDHDIHMEQDISTSLAQKRNGTAPGCYFFTLLAVKQLRKPVNQTILTVNSTLTTHQAKIKG
jgi:hypothetical protein